MARDCGRVETAHSSVDKTGLGWQTVLLLATAGYLYLNLFAAGRIPFLLSGDQTYFWMDAQRMLFGEQPYRDFFQFTPPGTDLVYLGLFKPFGVRIWATNFAVLALGVALIWVCFHIADKIMERRLALLAASLFLALIYCKALNGTHHWFSLLAVMCAVAVRFRHQAAESTLIAGALLGAASFFTQTRGVIALLAFLVFLLWDGFRAKRQWRSVLLDQMLLSFGFAIVLLALSARYISMVGWRQLWYFQASYARHYMLHGLLGQSMGLPAPLAWRTLPGLLPCLFVYALVPTVYAVVVWLCWRQQHNPAFQWEQVTLLALVGLFLLEVGFSLNWLRLYAVSMPAIILLVWVIARAGKARRYAVAPLWTFTIALALQQTHSRRFGGQRLMETPGGEAMVPPLAYEKLSWITLHANPGDLFFQAAWPGLYVPLQLRNPVFLDTVEMNQQARPEHIRLVEQQLGAKNVRFVLWAQGLDHPESAFPPDAVAPLREYLRQRYVMVHHFSDHDEIWERK